MVAAVVTAEHLHWGLDPVAFARATGAAMSDPDESQARLLRSKSRRILVNCTRQWGKSTTASRKALHGALFEPPGLTLLVSPSLRQSGELFRKVEAAIDALPRGYVQITEHNRTSITLKNGSRIVSLPASKDTIRGFSAPRRIIEDESAYVSDALYASVRPMLAASDGQYIAMSSPNGRRGHFFEGWTKGSDAIERIKVHAKDCPRITAEFLESERRSMGRDLFAQEYGCEFIDGAQGLVYRPNEDTVVSSLPKGDWSFIVGVDFGIVDLNAVAVLATRPGDRVTYVVEAYKKRATPSEMVAELVRVQERYHPVLIVGDLGGMGKAFAAEAEARYQVPIEPADKNNKLGFIRLLNAALERGELRVLKTCSDLADEWSQLGWTLKGTEDPAVENHASDATLYAWRACTSYTERLPVPEQGELEAWEANVIAKRVQGLRKEWWEQ